MMDFLKTINKKHYSCREWTEILTTKQPSFNGQPCKGKKKRKSLKLSKQLKLNFLIDAFLIDHCSMLIDGEPS